MSDLVLALTHRIPVVAAKTAVGAQRLQDAQDAVGLSNEAVARLVPVSEKTWRRWKEAGTIPTAALPAVARALRLELRDTGPPSVLEVGHPVDPLAELVAAVARLERGQAALLDGQGAILDQLSRLQVARLPGGARGRGGGRS